MKKVFDEVGLVLLRGNRDMGNHLEQMKLWAEFIFPSLSQYEAGANARKGKVTKSHLVCSSSFSFLRIWNVPFWDGPIRDRV